MSIQGVSTTWFNSRPINYDSINLSDSDDYSEQENISGTHNQIAVDSQSFKEEQSDNDSGLDDLYFNSVGNYSSKKIDDLIKSKKNVEDLQTNEDKLATTLSGSLGIIAHEHFQSQTKSSERQKLEQSNTVLLNSRTSYFPEDEYESSDEPVTVHLDDIKMEEEEDPLFECLKRSMKHSVIKQIDSSTYNHLNSKYHGADHLHYTQKEISHREKAHVKPIDQNTLSHLNHSKKVNKKSHKTSTVNSGAKENKISNPYQFSDAEKVWLAPPEFEIKRRSPPKHREPEIDKRPKRLEKWDPNPVPDNPPAFLSRNPDEIKKKAKEMPKAEIPVRQKQKSTSYERAMIQFVPEPIPKVHKQKMTANPPPCFYSMEERLEKKRKKELKQKINEASKNGEVYVPQTIQLKEDESDEDEKELSPEELNKKLKETLDKQAEEWIEPPQKTQEKNEEIVESQEYDFPDDSEISEEENQDAFKPKQVYVDPHQTMATKLRNQAIRQKLTLREENKRVEEENLLRQERRRRETAREMAPTIKKLAQMSNFRAPSLDHRIERFKQDNLKNRAELISRLTDVKFQEPLITTEARVLDAQGKAKAKERREKQNKEMEERLKSEARGQRKKKLLELWQV